MEKFKKIDKKFLLSDSTVNVYGFRLLTGGYLLDEYKKNPIGYLMHKRDDGVLVKWEDLSIEGDSIYAKPVINMSHTRAQQTVDEIENGFLNAASCGHFVVLEYSDDPSLKLPGQTGPTVTKWFNRECSLVDIPGNMNALSLYDKDENPINLSDFTKPKISDMKQIYFTGAQLAAMNLKADADDLTVSAAFSQLVAKASKADGLQIQLDNLTAQINTDKVQSQLDAAMKAGKITKALSDKLAVDYAKNPEGLKNLLDSIPVYQPITTQLGEQHKKFVENLSAKSWDELDKEGLLPDLKAKDFEAFKQKYKEKFGEDYK